MRLEPRNNTVSHNQRPEVTRNFYFYTEIMLVKTIHSSFGNYGEVKYFRICSLKYFRCGIISWNDAVGAGARRWEVSWQCQCHRCTRSMLDSTGHVYVARGQPVARLSIFHFESVSVWQFCDERLFTHVSVDGRQFWILWQCDFSSPGDSTHRAQAEHRGERGQSMYVSCVSWDWRERGDTGPIVTFRPLSSSTQ